MLDAMASEAVWLRNLLGLPERDTWIEKKDEPTISDDGETQIVCIINGVNLICVALLKTVLLHYRFSCKQRWKE